MTPLLRLLRALAWVLPTAVLAQASPEVTIQGQRFAADAIVAGHRLPLNGAGVGTDFLAALYVSRKSTTAAQILSAPGPKRLQLRVIKEMPSKQFGQWLGESMTANLSASEASPCMPGLLQLGEVLAARKRLAAGEQIAFDAVPGQGTVMRIGADKVATLPAAPMFGCLLQAYVGPKPRDDALKLAMLGQKR